MECKYCGAQLNENAKFCSQCGKEVKVDLVEETESGIKVETTIEETVAQNEEPIEEVTIEEQPIEEETFEKVSVEEESSENQSQDTNDAYWYYVSVNNTQSGPYTLAQMIDFLKQRIIYGNTYVWKPGMANWIFLKDSELAAYMPKHEQPRQFAQTNTTNSASYNPSFYLPRRSIGLYLVLSIVTCGLFYWFWLYQMTNDYNQAKRSQGQQEFESAGIVVLLTIVTCGIYLLYYYWKMGKGMKQMVNRNGYAFEDNSVIMLVCQLLGVGVISACILQSNLNELSNQ